MESGLTVPQSGRERRGREAIHQSADVFRLVLPHIPQAKGWGEGKRCGREGVDPTKILR